jgi:hypothetical protein
MSEYINTIFPHKVKNASQWQSTFMSVLTLTTSSITITTKIKKKLSAYFLSHSCKMIVFYLGIPQYLQRNVGVVTRKGHDSFLFSPFQFTGMMELHLNHTMPCLVCMNEPKCILLYTIIHFTPHYTTTQSRHIFNKTFLIMWRKWEVDASSTFQIPHSKGFI